MHLSASVRQARWSRVEEFKRLKAIMGSIALSWSWPASAANETVTSLPITAKATWLTTSGMMGLTLPGMMVDPGAMAGRWISLKPQRGPDESSRRSLHTFDNLTATRFRTPDSWT
jgi:hypothetical protein